MKYISEDGKIFENEQECLQHESTEKEKKLRAKAERKEREEKISKEYEEIQNLIETLCGKAISYKKLTGETLYITIRDGNPDINAYYSTSPITCEGMDNFINQLKRVYRIK